MYTRPIVIASVLFFLSTAFLLRPTESVPTFGDIPFALAATNGSDLKIFLKVDGAAGDTMDEKHPKEMELDSFAFGLIRTPGTSKPTMQEFKVTMPVNSASSRLFLIGAGAGRVPKVILTVRKGTDKEFLRWILTDAAIGSYQTVGNTHGDGVVDQVTFHFSKIEMEYRSILPDGSMGALIKNGWDLRTGKPV